MDKFLEGLEELHAQVSQEAAVLIDAQGDLVDTYLEVAAVESVDREQGKVIIKHAPSLESYTPNMFTLFPTKTNYSVALEGFWDGMATIAGNIFEGIFKLIVGTLKLFVRPLTWLLGDGDNVGATSKARDAVEEMAKDESVAKMDKAELKEIVEEVVDGKPLNMWEFLFFKKFDADVFITMNEYVDGMYEFILKTNADFISNFEKIKGSTDSTAEAHKLLFTTSKYNEELSKSSGKLLGIFKPIIVGIGNYTSSEDVANGFTTIKDAIAAKESTATKESLVVEAIMGKLQNPDKLLGDLKDGLDFEKSDEGLLKATNGYHKSFDSMRDKTIKVVTTKLGDLELEPEAVKQVRIALEMHTQVMQRSNQYISAVLGFSIKGKRAMLKAVNVYKKIYAASPKSE